MRRNISINQGWIFIKGANDISTASSCPGIATDLPHTWNAMDGQDGGNDYYRGICWYIKMLPEVQKNKSERVWLEFQLPFTASIFTISGKSSQRMAGWFPM